MNALGSRASASAGPGACVLVFLLICLGTAVSPLASQTGTLHGRIRSEASGQPLAGAMITLTTQARRVVQFTDAAGGYRFGSLAGGRWVLEVTHPGFAPLELQLLLAPGGELALDLALQLQPVSLDPIVAHGGAISPSATADTLVAPPASLAEAAAHSLESVPGMTDLVRGGAPPPTGQEPPDPSDVLFVRGSAADLKLVLLDGAPIYSPFHLGGLIAPFEPNALGSANLYLGGAPPRYDGGLAYVLDLRTRAARRDRPRAVAAFDLLSARALVESPLTRHAGLLLSARGVHAAGTAPLAKGPFPYGYGDGLARLDVELGDDSDLRLTGFANRETVLLGEHETSDSAAWWGNGTVSARYRRPLGGTRAELTAALSGFAAQLPLSQAGQPAQARTGTERARLHLELARETGPFRVRYGLSYDQIDLWRQVRSQTEAGDLYRLHERGTGRTAGAYLDAGWTVHRDLRLRGGARADVFSLERGLRIAPRLSASWQMSEHGVVTLAAGRYHQQVRAPESVWPERDTANPLLYTVEQPLSVAEASHLTLSLNQEIARATWLGLEGFYKQFSGMPIDSARTAASSGVDVSLRREAGAVTGWLTYSLAWIWSMSDGFDGADRFSGRELVTLGANAPFARSGLFHLTLSVGRGMPITGLDAGTGLDGPAGDRRPDLKEPPPDATPFSDAATEPFVRLDLRLSRTWSPRVRGRTMQLTPYLHVVNALDRRDGLFYRVREDLGAKPSALASVPVLPVLGFEWRF